MEIIGFDPEGAKKRVLGYAKGKIRIHQKST